jgi:hypothetical protein
MIVVQLPYPGQGVYSVHCPGLTLDMELDCDVTVDCTLTIIVMVRTYKYAPHVFFSLEKQRLMVGALKCSEDAQLWKLKSLK